MRCWIGGAPEDNIGLRQKRGPQRDCLWTIEVDIRAAAFISKDDADILWRSGEVARQFFFSEPERGPSRCNSPFASVEHRNREEPTLCPPARGFEGCHAVATHSPPPRCVNSSYAAR